MLIQAITRKLFLHSPKEHHLHCIKGYSFNRGLILSHNRYLRLRSWFLYLLFGYEMLFFSLHSALAADRTIESGNYIIEMTKINVEADPGNGLEGGEGYLIIATDRIKNISVTVEKTPLVKLLIDIRVVAGTKLLLRTHRKLNYGTESNSLYDLRTGKRLGGWMGHGSSSSPSGRYLAYITHYPRLCLTAYHRSILLICDFEKDIAKYDPGFIEALAHSDTMCGAPAFPERNAYEHSYDVLLDDEYLIHQHFLWSKDEKTLVGFATNVPDRKFYIIRIELAAGIDHLQIFKKHIDVDPLIDYSKLFSKEVDKFKKRLPSLYYEKLWWSGDNRVTIQASEYSYYKKQEMEFTIPEFHEY